MELGLSPLNLLHNYIHTLIKHNRLKCLLYIFLLNRRQTEIKLVKNKSKHQIKCICKIFDLIRAALMQMIQNNVVFFALFSSFFIFNFNFLKINNAAI